MDSFECLNLRVRITYKDGKKLTNISLVNKLLNTAGIKAIPY